MLEFLGHYAAALAHPLVSATLGFLTGTLAGLVIGRRLHRSNRVNDLLRDARAAAAEQLERGPLRHRNWLGPGLRDKIETDLPPWRRRAFRAAWQRYAQEHERQSYPFSAITLLNDEKAVLATLGPLHRELRPV